MMMVMTNDPPGVRLAAGVLVPAPRTPAEHGHHGARAGVHQGGHGAATEPHDASKV